MSLQKPTALVVFYANPEFYPPTRNAIGQLARDFDVSMLFRGSDAELRWRPPSVRFVPSDGNRGLPATSSSRIEKLGEFARFCVSLARVVREVRPRFIYAYEPHAMVAAGLVCPNVPCIYQRHELEEFDRLQWSSLQDLIARAALPLSRRAEVVVFPELRRAEIYARKSRDRRSAMIVPNFPSSAIFPEPDSWDDVFARRLERNEALYRGAIGGANGVLECVDAASGLPEGMKLRLCGPLPGAFRGEFQRALDRLGPDRVRYDGVIPYERMNRETLEATVGFALYKPVDKNWEHNVTATNKIYEYAACGVPVVVPDRPSYREFFVETSWVAFADPGSTRQIADAARSLIDPDGYRERALAARRDFVTRYNYETVFAPLLERIRGLANIPSPDTAPPSGPRGSA